MLDSLSADACRAGPLTIPREQYMEKRVFCQLNGNRKVIGILRGYDVRQPFHNIRWMVAVMETYRGNSEIGPSLRENPSDSRRFKTGLISRPQVFMNIVLDEAFEEKTGGEKVAIGMVVCTRSLKSDL